MNTLRRMTADEFTPWREQSIRDYAKEKVASGHWSKETAEEQARVELARLLPDGLASDGNYLYAIEADGGQMIGTLWFAVQARFGLPIAYVYNVEIRPEHRRKGHARRAFAAIEKEVSALGLHGVALHVFGHNTAARALYQNLGYEPTNINLFKLIRTSG